ncbi:BolA family transcriptional regulator [bacterium]|nr:BolA family transcriptional regulator [bacterium]
MDIEAIKNRISGAIPESQVWAEDLQGGDHVSVTVVSSAFEGKSRIQQHQMVYALFKSEMATEDIHAMALKTLTPREHAAQTGG